MDSFEWNKIAGAVLFALLVAFGLNAISEMVFETEAPEAPGYVIAVAAEGEAGEGEGTAPTGEPIDVLLASADVSAGEASARKCGACHTFAEGEANKVGPNLYGVVGNEVAARSGYEYSEAMHAFAEKAGTWDYEHLNSFLANPKGVVPGTKMAFAGLRDDRERANVIAYLREQSANPPPLPEPEAAETPAAEGGEAAPEGETAGPEVEAEESATAPGEVPAEEGAVEQPPESAAEIDEPVEQRRAGEAAEQPAEGDEPEQAQSASAGEAAEDQTAAAEQDVAQTEAPAEGEAPAAEGSAFAAMVASANAEKGATFAKRCLACHTFDEGGENRVGPNLWGIVNRPIASVPDFEYSEAMVEFSEGGQKVWDYDLLDTYLAAPQDVVPGTNMVFPGAKKEEDRANLVAYLRTLAAEPAPLP